MSPAAFAASCTVGYAFSANVTLDAADTAAAAGGGGGGGVGALVVSADNFHILSFRTAALFVALNVTLPSGHPHSEVAGMFFDDLITTVTLGTQSQVRVLLAIRVAF